MLEDAEELEPDLLELPPLDDLVREAEEALTAAQASLAADTRSRVSEALVAKLAVMKGCRLGVFSGEEQARITVEEELADAKQGYRTARLALKHAMDGIAGWGERVRESERRLHQARRERFLQRERPELWQALQGAIAARAGEPWLQPQSDQRSVQAAQAKYRHQYAIEAAQKACEQACLEAKL